jgi:hypothetical protein
MAKFGSIYPLKYLSPFEEEYFFAYLNWTPTLDSQGYFQLKAQLDPIAGQNIASNTLTPTGETYSNLAQGNGTPVPEFPNPYLTVAELTLGVAVVLLITQTTRRRYKEA